jgi:hypothetical protein
MLRLFTILLSIYFLAGSAILPKGDFGFIYQISHLYDTFIQANGIVSYDEFLEEELLEPYSIPENEPQNDPGEKECHPVPIDLILVNANSIVDIPSLLIMSEPESSNTVSFTLYLENFPKTDPDPFFHPPRISYLNC